MDITPQVINEVEFHQKMRGYDPDEVDDFLERVALAVTGLQERLRDAADRVTQAERRAAELEQRLREAPPSGGGSSSIEEEADTIRRTLVLAQRTADAAIKEAEEQAQATIAGAREQADQIYREAQSQAQRLVADAETEARRAGEETRQQLVSEIIALEEARDAIRADQQVLERHVDDHRLRLRGTISDLERLLDDPARLRVTAPPPITGATRPAFLEGESLPPPAALSEPAAPAPVLDLDSEPQARAQAEREVDLVTTPAPGGVTYTAPEVDDLAEPPAFGVSTSEEDAAWARFVGEEGGPPTQPVRIDDAGDDAYLAELRKAMLDDSGSGNLFDTDDDQRRTRFGRRR